MSERLECVVKALKRRKDYEHVHICADCSDAVCVGLGDNPKCPQGFPLFKGDRRFVVVSYPLAGGTKEVESAMPEGEKVMPKQRRKAIDAKRMADFMVVVAVEGYAPVGKIEVDLEKCAVYRLERDDGEADE